MTIPGGLAMDFGLSGKRALVTGSTAGIGFAIAGLLAREGAFTIINGRTKQRVTAARKRIKSEIPSAQIGEAAADLSTFAGIQTVIQSFPEVDILVNNLGIFEPKPFEDISDDDWFRFFETNVLSGVRFSRYYLPRMKQKNWGRIVPGGLLMQPPGFSNKRCCSPSRWWRDQSDGIKTWPRENHRLDRHISSPSDLNGTHPREALDQLCHTN